ncbi:hypothetical protein C9374_002381 [Naegleria lovaniensis]|uniref:Uncharacterized protein n=1 Tax=Naegleria lovaniensis TaxID=51637 RepID=A0AA88KQP0_NAELO|nr:uncharacterized protein C9374_002381 [Naegleria lovaniensis]KAG2386637.1 hypothetical protein C9374_002381 [Naegleria lovaniensis]
MSSRSRALLINVSFARDQEEDASNMVMMKTNTHFSTPNIQIEDSDEEISPLTSSSSASNSTGSLTCCGHLGGSEMDELSVQDDHSQSISSLFTRLGLNLSRKPSRECSFSQELNSSSSSFNLSNSSYRNTDSNTLSTTPSINSSSSFPLLLAPSNKSQNSMMVFSTPSPSSEDNESQVRDILSSISSRFHNAKKTSNCIIKPKKMKSKRFTKSFEGHSSSNKY